MPRVSVIIAAYNCSDYISQSIDSVLKQDYPSFEIVVGDDGSTDSTFKIAKSYRKYPLVKVIAQKHKGQGHIKNRLIDEASGKYIALFDADDVMCKGRIRMQAEILDKNPSCGACYGKVKLVNSKLKPIKDKIFGTQFGSNLQDSWDIIRTPISAGTLMFRKALVRKIGGFDEKFDYSADTDFVYRLTENTQPFFLDKFLILYRRHQSSASHNPKIWKEESAARRLAIKRRYNFDVKYL